MAHLFLRDTQLSFGTQTLLNKINFQIEPNERVCIVGRNGEGKSTLLKVVEGSMEADDGSRIVQDGIKIAKLQQEVPNDMKGTVFHIIANGLGNMGALLDEYHLLSHQLAEDYQESILDRMTDVQHEIEKNDGWALNQKVETVISKLELPAEAEFSDLSGGMKRRVLLAQALVQTPDILLLDEPTNHLDIPSIQWLEEFLKNLNCSLVFITHDRAFLQALATRIVELDRGNLYNWECDYLTYLQRKEEQLESEAKTNAVFDKKLALEETWIRQGIKARRTRNEGRVRALEKLRSEHQARRSQQGKANLQSNTATKSGKQVIEVSKVSYQWPTKTIVSNFSTMIMRGDKVGIIGANGCGKSTLLKLILGDIQPTSGEIKLGTNLKIAYFDQHRVQLDENAQVVESVVEESDYIEINGQRKHVMGYLQDFLFSPERARQPVKSLSGGERNRLLLARVFAKPSNLLILDEPTNDLDVETLELLEELVMNYQGTVLIVSHDRAFLNAVATSSIVFDAPGVVNEYVGGYDDWLRQKPDFSRKKTTKKNNPIQLEKVPEDSGKTVKKLSFKDQHEYDSLPKKIELIETEITQLNAKMAKTDFYQQANFQETVDKAKSLETKLEQVYERWEEIEAKLN